MTKTNNKIVLFTGDKNDGKTTFASYCMEVLNTPSIIVDVAKQFKDDRKYRKVVKGLRGLRYMLLNPNNKKAFYKGKLQIIYRNESKDLTKEIDSLVDILLENEIKDITILFDEIELYATSRMTNKNSMYHLFVLSRNLNINILGVSKTFGDLSKLIKGQADYYAFSTIGDTNSVKYLDDKSKGRVSKELENITKHEFILTDLKTRFGTWKRFKMNRKILTIINT